LQKNPIVLKIKIFVAVRLTIIMIIIEEEEEEEEGKK
jgi:hypothetical protein